MIRFRLAEILKAKGWTPYRLSQETGLTAPTTYRLADPSMKFGRFTSDTLGRLCQALDVQPGDLLEYVPPKPGSADAERSNGFRRGNGFE